MGSITDYLYRIQELANTNMKILSAINESLTSKKDFLSVEIGGQNYVIPSMICLENRINTLQADFEELVDIPKTGSALLHLDGTTQKLQLKGYSNTPDSSTLEQVSRFFIDNTDVFKDFMTPSPYVRLALPTASDDAKTVNIKKISITNSAITEALQSSAQDGKISYGAVRRVLQSYTEDVDYREYNTLRRMPIKDGAPLGKYTVRRIIDHTLDASLEEHYYLELAEPITYTDSNETSEGTLQPGDWLIGNGDRVKFTIESADASSRTVRVKVMYGSYAEVHDLSGQPDKYTLKYYRHSDYSAFKHIDVPLEEDRWIVLFAAIVNDDLNIQSPWGSGLLVDTDTLTVDINGTILSFRDYYNRYVTNLGDSLFGICTMVDNTLTNTTRAELDAITSYKPVMPASHYTVTRINKHLDDSQTVQAIRKLHNEKSKHQNELATVEDSIERVTKMLSEMAFDDTSNNRQTYTGQLRDLQARRGELVASITAVTQEIANQANNTELPIENAKYHIRGYADAELADLPKPIRIDVEYRYKNKSLLYGNAMTINDEFIYSDWNRMTSITEMRSPVWDSVGIKYEWPQDSTNRNVPSWNQIDIPISQGESVDFKFRYVFDLGWPFVSVHSSWSDICQVDFPQEFLANVEVLDIVESNNSDARVIAFDSKLKKEGVYEHVGDSVKDQDMIYLHKPDSIASGFVTNERRVIPLSEKLSSMDFDITELKSEVYGVNAEDLLITVTDSSSTTVLRPYVENVIEVADYNSNTNREDLAGKSIAYEQLTLTIYNGSTYNAKLFTMFPGPHNSILPVEAPSRYNGSDYTACTYNTASGSLDYSNGVWMQTDTTNALDGCTCNCGCATCDHGSDLKKSTPQHYNQYLYFRYNDIYTASPYYEEHQTLSTEPGYKTNDSTSKAVPVNWDSAVQFGGESAFATLFPYVGVLSNICIESGENFKIIRPGESISLPISFYYWIGSNQEEGVSRKIAFDFRTSLYKDPVTYRMTVNAGKVSKIASKVKRSSDFVGSKYLTQIQKSVTDVSVKKSKEDSASKLPTKHNRR